MDKTFAGLGAILAAVAVGLGAFGAHGLKGKISEHFLEVYQVGVLYHLVHALALIAVAWGWSRWPGRPMELAGWLFVVGITLFSGSLYVLATTGWTRLGMITPLGGIALIAGWLFFAAGAWKSIG